MSGALCIDFGTSSIRAVRRQPSGKLKTLDIGRVTKSKLDDASIRSEIHVDEHRRYVRYGERAFVARKDTNTPALYEASPKLWLKEPDRLGDEAAPGLGLTREQLLCGLLAYAIRAAADADEIGMSTLKSIDIRIAHPVWPAHVKAAANAALARICAQARQMAFEREWGTVTVASLLEHVQAPATPRAAAVDVVEPVAAAAELLPSEENLVRMCAVVDVGAGTTDIGLFLSLVPDGASSVRSKLYRTGEPVSVFKAGNVVDGIVLKLLEARAKQPSAIALADVRARIRGIKETLFRDGFIQELGCDVHLKDLTAHPEAKTMAREIRSQLLGLVRNNAKTIGTWLDKPVHSVSRLDVVMAGGGGGIDFVLSAINQPIPVDHRTLQVRLTIPEERTGINTYGASRGRMAVALGGASHDYDTLVHEQPTLTKIRRGSL
jgi:molecular chaperone HscA